MLILIVDGHSFYNSVKNACSKLIKRIEISQKSLEEVSGRMVYL